MAEFDFLDITDVYLANEQSTAKIVINQGGTSSSKTYSIVQLLYKKAIEKKRVITVTGESIPNLKKGAYRDAETIYSDTKQLKSYVESWNKTDRIVYFKNGSIIEFTSNLDEQSAKNGKRDILFCNELNGINYRVFWQLAIRTREQIFADYNPTAPFFAHEKLIGTGPGTNDLGATVELIISDHRHNTFLSQEQHDQIESIKDPDLRRVYARGATGKVTGLIFGHFVKCDGPPETFDRIIWGADWGWTNDPTSIVKIWCRGRDRWVKEVCYEPGISADQIKEILFLNGYKSSQMFYGDHSSDMINQIRLRGIPIIPAIKGPGCEVARISKVREHNCYYFDSPNLEKELMAYKFMTFEDITTGKTVLSNQPIKGNDHAIDAVAYADYSDSFKHRA